MAAVFTMFLYFFFSLKIIFTSNTSTCIAFSSLSFSPLSFCGSYQLLSTTAFLVFPFLSNHSLLLCLFWNEILIHSFFMTKPSQLLIEHWPFTFLLHLHFITHSFLTWTNLKNSLHIVFNLLLSFLEIVSSCFHLMNCYFCFFVYTLILCNTVHSTHYLFYQHLYLSKFPHLFNTFHHGL